MLFLLSDRNTLWVLTEGGQSELAEREREKKDVYARKSRVITLSLRVDRQ